MNAQGEDVVAGTRTPLQIIELNAKDPKCYNDLLAIRERLEHHYNDMLYVEFTIQRRKLYIPKCRVGIRTAIA